MSLLDYTTLTMGDLCKEALFEAGVVGTGLTPSGDDITRAWSRLQFVLQAWQRKRWMIFGLESFTTPSNGGTSYTIGQGGTFNLGVSDFNNDLNNDFGSSIPVNRPSRLEGVFFRQPTHLQLQGGDFSQDFSPDASVEEAAQPGPGFIDYPLQAIEAGEDYWTRVRLKSLLAWPEFYYYQADWPLGTLYLYPGVPKGYQIGIVVRDLLPVRNTTLTSLMALPPEYHLALLLSTAVALCSAYKMPPDPLLLGREAEALRTLRKTNTRVARSIVGKEWTGTRGRYNIFSDQTT